MKTLKLFVALALCALVYSCSQTPAEPVKAEPDLIVIESPYLKCNDSILVFSPVCPATNAKVADNQTVPTVFLLHGWSGCYKDWSNKYDLQQISNRTGYRIICPDGFYDSWYLNWTDTTQMQWRTFFDKECFPMMKERYNLVPDSTFITGLSMGGHGAMNLFLDHPENFGAGASMSGVLDLRLTNLKTGKMAQILGDRTDRIATESAYERIVPLADTLKALGKPLIFTCGYEDIYVPCTSNFAERCRELGIPHIFILSPGKHSWKYWGFALEQHLWHFTKIMNKENLGY